MVVGNPQDDPGGNGSSSSTSASTTMKSSSLQQQQQQRRQQQRKGSRHNNKNNENNHDIVQQQQHIMQARDDMSFPDRQRLLDHIQELEAENTQLRFLVPSADEVLMAASGGGSGGNGGTSGTSTSTGTGGSTNVLQHTQEALQRTKQALVELQTKTIQNQMQHENVVQDLESQLAHSQKDLQVARRAVNHNHNNHNQKKDNQQNDNDTKQHMSNNAMISTSSSNNNNNSQDDENDDNDNNNSQDDNLPSLLMAHQARAQKDETIIMELRTKVLEYSQELTTLQAKEYTIRQEAIAQERWRKEEADDLRVLNDAQDEEILNLRQELKQIKFNYQHVQDELNDKMEELQQVIQEQQDKTTGTTRTSPQDNGNNRAMEPADNDKNNLHKTTTKKKKSKRKTDDRSIASVVQEDDDMEEEDKKKVVRRRRMGDNNHNTLLSRQQQERNGDEELSSSSSSSSPSSLNSQQQQQQHLASYKELEQTQQELEQSRNDLEQLQKEWKSYTEQKDNLVLQLETRILDLSDERDEVVQKLKNVQQQQQQRLEEQVATIEEETKRQNKNINHHQGSPKRGSPKRGSPKGGSPKGNSPKDRGNQQNKGNDNNNKNEFDPDEAKQMHLAPLRELLDQLAKEKEQQAMTWKSKVALLEQNVTESQQRWTDANRRLASLDMDHAQDLQDCQHEMQALMKQEQEDLVKEHEVQMKKQELVLRNELDQLRQQVKTLTQEKDQLMQQLEQQHQRRQQEQQEQEESEVAIVKVDDAFTKAQQQQQAEEELVSLREQVVAFTQSDMSLKEQYKVMQYEKDQEIMELKEKLQDRDTTISALVKSSVTMEQQIASMQIEMDLLVDKLSRAKSSTTNANSEEGEEEDVPTMLANYKETETRLTNEVLRFKRQLHHVKVENGRLRHKMREINHNHHENNNNNNNTNDNTTTTTLTNENDDNSSSGTGGGRSHSSSGSVTSQQQQLKERDEAISRLVKQTMEQEECIVDLKKKVKTLKRESQQQQPPPPQMDEMELEQLRQETEMFAGQVIEQDEEIENLKRILHDKENKLNTTEQEIDKYRQSAKIAHERANELDIIVTQLQTKVEELTKLVETSSTSSSSKTRGMEDEDMAAVAAAVTASENNNQGSSDTNAAETAQLMDRIYSLEAEVDELRESNSEQLSELRILRRTAHDSGLAADQLTSAQRDAALAQEVADHASNRVRELQQELDHLKSHMPLGEPMEGTQSSDTMSAKAGEKVTDDEKEVIAIVQQKEQENCIADLRNELVERDRIIGDLKHLANMASQIGDEIELCDEIDTLKQDLTNKTIALEAAEETIRELQQRGAAAEQNEHDDDDDDEGTPQSPEQKTTDRQAPAAAVVVLEEEQDDRRIADLQNELVERDRIIGDLKQQQHSATIIASHHHQTGDELELCDEIDSLKQKLANKTMALEAAQETIREWQRVAAEQSEQEGTQSSSAQKAAEEAAAIQKELEGRIADLRNELVERDRIIGDLKQQQHSAATTTTASQNGDETELCDEIDSLKQNLANQTMALEAAQETIRELERVAAEQGEQDLARFEEDKDEMMSEVEHLTQQLDEAQATIDQLRKDEEVIREFKSKLEQVDEDRELSERSIVDIYERKLSLLRLDNDVLVDKLRTELQTAKATNAKTQEESTSQISTLETHIQELEEHAEQEIRQRDGQIFALEKTLDASKQLIANMKTEMDHLQGSMVNATVGRREEIEDMQQELVTLTATAARQEREVNMLRQRLEDKEVAHNSQVLKLQETIELLESQTSSENQHRNAEDLAMELKVKEVKDRLDKLKWRNSNLQEENNELRDRLEKSTGGGVDTIANQTELEAAQEKVASLQLKVAEQSKRIRSLEAKLEKARSAATAAAAAASSKPPTPPVTNTQPTPPPPPTPVPTATTITPPPPPSAATTTTTTPAVVSPPARVTPARQNSKKGLFFGRRKSDPAAI